MYWDRFQRLHGFLWRAGSISEQIHLTPNSFLKLEQEMTKGAGLTGAVTHYGPVKIVCDPLGIDLDNADWTKS